MLATITAYGSFFGGVLNLYDNFPLISYLSFWVLVFQFIRFMWSKVSLAKVWPAKMA